MTKLRNIKQSGWKEDKNYFVILFLKSLWYTSLEMSGRKLDICL